MKVKINSIRVMVYLLGFYLFVTSDFEMAWFDWVWFFLFAIAYLFPTFWGIVEPESESK